MNTPFQLSDKERSIRKFWLICSLIFIFGTSLLSASHVAFLYSKGLVIRREMAIAWFSSVCSFIAFFVIYHCAYKKHGTRLLLLCFFCAPIKILGIILVFRQMQVHSLSLLSIGIDGSLYIYWYLLSVRLWKINRRVKCQKLNPFKAEAIQLNLPQDAS